MCVRYSLHRPGTAIDTIAETIARALAVPQHLEPRFNAGPSQRMPVVVASAEPHLCDMTWGLIPPFQKPQASPRFHTNAKAETARQLPSFQSAVSRRRCLIPANGFFEWERQQGFKQPHYFTLLDERPFAFAGIWEPGDTTTPDTYAILTTAPNSLVGTIHHRMPVILTGDSMLHWLQDQPITNDIYAQITRPIDPLLMQSRPVNRHVNNVRNEGPQCLSSPDPATLQMGLFSELPGQQTP